MNNLNLEGITYSTRDEKPTVSHQEDVNNDDKYLHHFGNDDQKSFAIMQNVQEAHDEEEEQIYAQLSNMHHPPVEQQAEDEEEEEMDADDDDWPSGDDIHVTLAMNEAATHLVSEMIDKVEKALTANKDKQKALLARQAALREEANKKKKMPVQVFLPPYFKDEHNMCPALSEEAKAKLAATDYDPLAREEKKWNSNEITRLKTYVRKAMLDIYIEPLVSKRDELFNSVRTAGVEVPQAQIQAWREEWEQCVRKINFHSQMSLEGLCNTIDPNDVDWTKMANIDFGGLRTPTSLRLKWFNEVSPRWNQKPWTKQEVTQLKKIVEEEMFITWQHVASKLGTNRTVFQCFEKYKSEIFQNTKAWTPEEDEKLITLCNIIKIGNEIQWDKVSYYMPGRSRQQVRVRYLRSLDKSIKHGKWSDQEDLLLLCAVNRIGPQNWKSIATNVPGRTDVQCRERWSSVLDKNSISREWTMEEDEKLVFLVNTLGRSCWSKLCTFINRTADNCRYRYQSHLNHKISNAVTEKPHNKNEPIGDYEKRNVNKKLKLNRIYRKYDNMMASITSKDEGIDKMMEAVHNTPKPAQSKRRALDGETVAVVNAGLAEITERYKNHGPLTMDQLLQQVAVQDSDIKYWQKRRQSMNKQKKDKAEATGDNRRRRTIILRKHLQEKPEIKEFHDNLMTSDASEAEKQDGMYDILINCVNRVDTQEFIKDFSKHWNETGALIATDIATEMLTSKLDEDLEKLKLGEDVGFKSTLPVNWANWDFFSELQKARPLLLKKASELFIKSDASVKDPFYHNNLLPDAFVEPSTSLYLPLNKEITQSEEYLKTKLLLRNAIFEPMIYETAVYDAKKMENLNKIREDLLERQKEEELVNLGALPMPPQLTAEEIEARLKANEPMPRVTPKERKPTTRIKHTREAERKPGHENDEDEELRSIGSDEINMDEMLELEGEIHNQREEKVVTRSASRQGRNSAQAAEINEEELEEDKPLAKIKGNKAKRTRKISDASKESGEIPLEKNTAKRRNARKK